MGSIATAPLSFNLLLGRPYPHSAQDLDEAKQLCHELGLGPLLERMPAGLDQIVGETGWQLSQGERGRVSLARALLQNAEVVMLDESLGALDPQNSQAMPGLCDSEGKDTSGGGTSMNTDRAVKLQEQAWNLEAEGKLDEAAIAVRKALLLLQESDEANSPDAANLLNDLAEIESERQSFQDASVLAERAHSIEDQVGDSFVGEGAAQIRARTMGLIGGIYRMLGDFVRAEVSLKEALRIVATEFGEASEHVADARNNLAVLYKACGRFDEGLLLYQKALDSVVKLNGEDCLASSVIYHNIGGILHAKGDFTAAELPGRKAWEISRRLLGEDDPRTLLDAVAYAGILVGLQRYGESEAIYRRALAIFERTFGPEHYEVASILHNLAAVLCARGDLDQAERLYLRALTIKETLLGAESPDAALTRNNLGALLNLKGRPREAVALLQNAVAVLQDRLAPDHPHVACARANLESALLSSKS